MEIKTPEQLKSQMRAKKYSYSEYYRIKKLARLFAARTIKIKEPRI